MSSPVRVTDSPVRESVAVTLSKSGSRSRCLRPRTGHRLSRWPPHPRSRHEIHVPQSRRTAGTRHQLEGTGGAVVGRAHRQLGGTQVAERSDPSSFAEAGDRRVPLARRRGSVEGGATEHSEHGEHGDGSSSSMWPLHDSARPFTGGTPRLDRRQQVGRRPSRRATSRRTPGSFRQASRRARSRRSPTRARCRWRRPRDEDRAGPADAICREPGEWDRTRFEACVIGVAIDDPRRLADRLDGVGDLDGRSGGRFQGGFVECDQGSPKPFGSGECRTITSPVLGRSQYSLSSPTSTPSAVRTMEPSLVSNRHSVSPMLVRPSEE